MKLIDLTEAEYSRTLVHGSGWELPIGIILSGHTGGFTSSRRDTIRKTERILEEARPEGHLSRQKSVFMVDVNDTNKIKDSGGYTNFIYKVAPLDPVETNHLGWWELINSAVRQAEEPNQLVEWAENYWSGVECKKSDHPILHKKDSTWEFRSPRARVIQLIDWSPGVVPKQPTNVKRWINSYRKE